MESKSLNVAISVNGQTATYVELFDCKIGSDSWPVDRRERHRLRISIASDSYDFQSHAKCERWNGEEWRRVEEIPYGSMRTPTGLASTFRAGGKRANPFLEDRNELMLLATLVLEGGVSK